MESHSFFQPRVFVVDSFHRTPDIPLCRIVALKRRHYLCRAFSAALDFLGRFSMLQAPREEVPGLILIIVS